MEFRTRGHTRAASIGPGLVLQGPWIERIYHRHRQQARLGRLTPVEYETIMTTPVTQAAQPNFTQNVRQSLRSYRESWVGHESPVARRRARLGRHGLILTDLSQVLPSSLADQVAQCPA